MLVRRSLALAALCSGTFAVLVAGAGTASASCATDFVAAESATVAASSPVTGTPPGSFGVRVPAAGPPVTGTVANAGAFVTCFV